MLGRHWPAQHRSFVGADVDVGAVRAVRGGGSGKQSVGRAHGRRARRGHAAVGHPKVSRSLPPPQVDARVPSLHHRVPVVGLGAVGRQPQHAARRTNVGYTTHTISTPRARTGLESRPSALLSRHRSPSPSRFGAACAPCASSGPWSASPRPSYACPCVSCSECRRVRRAARERAAAQGRAPGAIGGDQGEIRARSGRDQREIRGDRGPAPASAHPRARGP